MKNHTSNFTHPVYAYLAPVLLAFTVLGLAYIFAPAWLALPTPLF